MEHEHDLTVETALLRLGQTIWSVQSRLVFLYLSAIVAANLLIAWLGPWASPYTAGALIGLDLTAKDRLQDKWKRGMIWKMGLLISFGSCLSWMLNRNAGRIALASFVAFGVSATGDAIAYAKWRHLEQWRRVSISNLIGAVLDSVLFPLIAWGWPLDVSIVYGQMAAKVTGALIWALILIPRTDQ